MVRPHAPGQYGLQMPLLVVHIHLLIQWFGHYIFAGERLASAR